jgi:hypothetical protein
MGAIMIGSAGEIIHKPLDVVNALGLDRVLAQVDCAACRPAWPRIHRSLDTGTAGDQVVAILAGRKPCEQIAQQALLLCAEGCEQIVFGVVVRSGHACLDPPADRGYPGDAGAAIMRVGGGIQCPLRRGNRARPMLRPTQRADPEEQDQDTK